MIDIEDDELEAAATEIFEDAYSDGMLDELSYRTIRRRVEEKFDLETGVLDDSNYKSLLNAAIKRCVMNSNADVNLQSSPEKAAPKLKEKRKKKEMVFKSPEMVPTSESEGEGPSKKLDKTKVPTPKKPKLAKPKTVNSTEDDKSDADSVEEAPKPKKRRISKENADGKKPTKEKAKKTAPPASKDDEKVKRLKALVVACGVRKVWSKVFKDAPQPSQQITILKRMLAELGMKGRMSMEQAKAIREKRELAQELEDVQNYEKSVTRQVSRGRKATTKAESEPEEEQSENSEEDEPVIRRRKTARQAIQAFLDEESD